MNTKILSKDKDPMGAAILDYQKSGRAGRLRVLSSMFEEDEMPVKHLFRKVEEMPMLEQKALQLTKGRVLDIGAGSGCHTLALQEKGLEVKAIDISPLSCEAMELRGVKDAECINLFDEHLETGFDTILLLMNGTGIAGKIEHLLPSSTVSRLCSTRADRFLSIPPTSNISTRMKTEVSTSI